MPLRMIRTDRESIGQDVHFRWSSIFSGAFITLGFATFFLLIGDAVGLNIYNTVNPGVHGALKFWSWLYTAVTMVISYGLGSSLSSRAADVTSGASQGMASWGLATLIGTLVAVLVSPTVRAIFDGVGPNSGNWLAACIVVVGFFSATLGGMLGKSNVRHVETEGETEIIREERKTGVA